MYKHSRNIQKVFIRNEKGNVNSAMKILTDNMKNGILPLKRQTLNQLQLKHPEGKEASQEILLTDTPETIHPIKLLTSKRYKKLLLT